MSHDEDEYPRGNPVSVGNLVSDLLKRMPKRQANSDSCPKSQNVAPAKKARRWLGFRSA